MNLSPKKPTKTKMETKKKQQQKNQKTKQNKTRGPRVTSFTFKGVPINKAFTKL